MNMVNSRSPESLQKRYKIETNSILSLNKKLDDVVKNSMKSSAFRTKQLPTTIEKVL